jgi:hypothetical protein
MIGSAAMALAPGGRLLGSAAAQQRARRGARSGLAARGLGRC